MLPLKMNFIRNFLQSKESPPNENFIKHEDQKYCEDFDINLHDESFNNKVVIADTDSGNVNTACSINQPTNSVGLQDIVGALIVSDNAVDLKHCDTEQESCGESFANYSLPEVRTYEESSKTEYFDCDDTAPLNIDDFEETLPVKEYNNSVTDNFDISFQLDTLVKSKNFENNIVIENGRESSEDKPNCALEKFELDKDEQLILPPQTLNKKTKHSQRKKGINKKKASKHHAQEVSVELVENSAETTEIVTNSSENSHCNYLNLSAETTYNSVTEADTTCDSINEAETTCNSITEADTTCDSINEAETTCNSITEAINNCVSDKITLPSDQCDVVCPSSVCTIKNSNTETLVSEENPKTLETIHVPVDGVDLLTDSKASSEFENLSSIAQVKCEVNSYVKSLDELTDQIKEFLPDSENKRPLCNNDILEVAIPEIEFKADKFNDIGNENILVDLRTFTPKSDSKVTCENITGNLGDLNADPNLTEQPISVTTKESNISNSCYGTEEFEKLENEANRLAAELTSSTEQILLNKIAMDAGDISMSENSSTNETFKNLNFEFDFDSSHSYKKESKSHEFSMKKNIKRNDNNVLQLQVNQSEAGPEIATGLTSSDLKCASQFFKEAAELESQIRKNIAASSFNSLSDYASESSDSDPCSKVPQSGMPPNEERSAPEGTSSPDPRTHEDSEGQSRLHATGDGDNVNELLKKQAMEFEEKLLRQGIVAAEKEKQLHEAMKGERSRLQKVTASRDALLKLVEQYKGMLAALVAEKNKQSSSDDVTISTLEKEKQQAIEDLSNVEAAFSDVHRKYERTKQIVDTLKRNEETLRNAVADYEEKLQKQERKFIDLQKHAEAKVKEANDEFESLRRTNDQEMIKMGALLKKAEMKIISLQEALDRKSQENLELTQLCDDLISKVGTS